MNLKDLRAFESYIKPDNSTVIFKHISSLTENFYRENTVHGTKLHWDTQKTTLQSFDHNINHFQEGLTVYTFTLIAKRSLYAVFTI